MLRLKFWKANDDADERTAKKLGKFELLDELGRGAMGVVYLGRDVESDRQVAIKAIKLVSDAGAASFGNARERFLREVRILAWLVHPDIVTIYDVGEEHGVAYITMELLGGVELSRHVAPDNLLPLPAVLEIVARTADALAYAHEQNVVHCDVKPGNIMYDAGSGMVKVMDFGISRLSGFSVARPGMVVGSPLYMSPEQVRGKHLGQQSDLFSLGTTLYQLASGHLPFGGESDAEVMRRIVHDAPPDIRSFNPELPQVLSELLDRALQKNQGDRFSSGAEMAQAIRRCAATL